MITKSGQEPYKVETEIRGRPAAERRAVRQERSKPVVAALHAWLGAQLGRVSARSTLAEAIRYVLRHWDGLALFLDDGRLEPDTDVLDKHFYGFRCSFSSARATAWRRARPEVEASPRSRYRRSSVAAPVRRAFGRSDQAETKRA